MPFAPDLAVDVKTPAPRARSALVATVTQADGETAIASVSMAFPKAFTFNERFRPPRCQPEQEAARECPPESRIGTVSADSPLGAATGEVFVTDDFRLVAFAEAAGGLVSIKAVGTVSAQPDNSFAVAFSGLPDLPLRSVSFALEGGDLALLKTPERCGSYRLPAVFTSHQGETASAEPTVTIGGCAPAPAIRSARFARGVLSWKATRATTSTQVAVDLGRRGLLLRRMRGQRLALAALRPGRYTARLTPFTGARRGATRVLRFSVRR